MNKIPAIIRGCKVVVLGSRRSGKSSLIETLAQVEHRPNSIENVAVQHLGVEAGEDEYHEISLWDFSGHDGYRVIHELLLDDVDIALITIDRTKGQDDEEIDAIEYWSDVIRKISNEQKRPITTFLVVTKIDMVRPRALNERELFEIRDELEFNGIFYTSCQTHQGIGDLLNAIYDQINWYQQYPVDNIKLNTLKQLIDSAQYRDVVLDRHQLYIHLLEDSNDLISTTEYDDLLNALQYRGTLFQFPQRDHILLDMNLLERYVASILELPRHSNLHLGQSQEFVPVQVDTILERPDPFNIGISSEQHKRLNGLILYFLAYRDLLILDNNYVVFLSNLVQDRSLDLRNFSGALVLDMHLFPSLNYPQLIVRVNRSERYQLTSYWSNHAIFQGHSDEDRQYPESGYQIIQPDPHAPDPKIWIYCTDETPHHLRLLFETYVYNLITDMGNVATLDTNRYYCCRKCRKPFTSEQIDKHPEQIRCMVCTTINYLLPRPSQLSYLQQLELLQEAEEIVKNSVVIFNERLAHYKIKLSKIDSTIDCLFIFERAVDVIDDIHEINNKLRANGMNTMLIPTRGLYGVNFAELNDLLKNNQVSRIVYFVGGNNQIRKQIDLINLIHQHYQPLQFYFLVVVIHPTIITYSHPLINRGFNVIEWSPNNSASDEELLDRIRDNQLTGVEAVHGRLNTPALQEFPYLGQAILHFFSIDDISPVYYDSHDSDIMDLRVPKRLDLSQFWFANLKISHLLINRPQSLIYVRQHQDENEAKLVTKLRIKYQVEFLIIVDVNVLPDLDIRGNIKIIHLNVLALQDLMKTPANRDGWFRRYLVRNLQRGGAKFIEKILKFDINKAASADGIFFGHSKLIKTIRKETRLGVLKGRFIFGPMRSGKTSLLHKIHNILEDTQYTPVMETVGGFLSIESYIDHVLRVLEIDPVSNVTAGLWIHLLEDYQIRTGQTPVLLMDEMDYLLRMDNESGNSFRWAIRLLHEKRICVFFLSGHAILRNAVHKQTGNFSDMMEIYYARGIEKKAAADLLQEIMNQVDLRFTRSQIIDIYEGTGGVPYLMIYFCQELFNTMVSNDDDHDSTFDRYVQDFEVARVKDNQGYLTKLHEYFMYDHHEFLEIILKIIAKFDKITPEDIITQLSNLPNAEAEANIVFDSLKQFQIVEEIEIQETLHYRIKPRYLSHAFNKNIGNHRTLGEMEKHLLSET